MFYDIKIINKIIHIIRLRQIANLLLSTSSYKHCNLVTWSGWISNSSLLSITLVRNGKNDRRCVSSLSKWFGSSANKTYQSHVMSGPSHGTNNKSYLRERDRRSKTNGPRLWAAVRRRLPLPRRKRASRKRVRARGTRATAVRRQMNLVGTHLTRLTNMAAVEDGVEGEEVRMTQSWFATKLWKSPTNEILVRTAWRYPPQERARTRKLPKTVNAVDDGIGNTC